MYYEQMESGQASANRHSPFESNKFKISKKIPNNAIVNTMLYHILYNQLQYTKYYITYR